MKKLGIFKYLFWALGGAFLVVAFNNCGEGFVAERLNGSGFGGSGDLFSRAPGDTCESALLKVYQNSYHPFLNQNCNACHINGPGIGTFANPDVKASFDSFMSIGGTKINAQAVNPSHKPPYTGTQNTARIEELTTTWANAQTAYASCVADSGGGNAVSFVVKTTSRTVPANLGRTTFVRMEWDLETASASKVPLVAGIEIRQAALNNMTIGYEFRNPTLRLKNTSSGNYNARSLNIFVNDQLQSDVTTYVNVDMVVGATTDLNLSPGTANAFNARTVAATDTIALEFANLGSTSGAANPGTNPTPVPGTNPTPVGAVTFTQLNANGGIFRNSCNSCHNANNARGSLDMTVYANARLAAQNIRSRVNNPNNPMPTGGLLPQNQIDQINAWVDSGAPQ